MALVLGFHVDKPEDRAGLRGRIASAFGEDDGSHVWEVGRPETGATCAVVDEGDGRLSLHVPLMRTPTLAADVIPPAFHAARQAGAWLGLVDDDAPRSLDELLAIWEREHRDAVRQLAALCAAQGLPPPPHLPRAELEALHGWLVAAAGTEDVPHPILALDPANGERAIVVVRLPRPEEIARCRLPGVHAVLADLGPPRDEEEPAVYPVSALGGERDDRGFLVVDTAKARDALRAQQSDGEALAKYRVISPVEIVDDEAFA